MKILPLKTDDFVTGNAAANVGYSCKQRELVKGWRAIWSETEGTTAADAYVHAVAIHPGQLDP